MGKINVAVVGLGRVGTAFLYGMISQKEKGIEVVVVSEIRETTGVSVAKKSGIARLSLVELVKLGDKIDVIFDLSGILETRKELREALEASNNSHTTIATEHVAQLVWALITNKPLPDVHKLKGY